MKGPRCTRQSCLVFFAAMVSFACSSDRSGESSQQVDHTDQSVSVADILQNNLKAVRADSAANNIRNTDQIIRISEPAYTLIGRYRASSDGYMRIDVFDGDTRVYSEGKDEIGVWEWPGGADQPENVYHDGVGALEHGIEFNLIPLAEFSNRGHDVELVGQETIFDKLYFTLKITLSDGFETYRYVNAETWLIDISRDFRAFHPAVDDTKVNIETRFDQWKSDMGIIFASRSQNVDRGTGEIMGTASVLRTRYNIAREGLDLERSYVPNGAPESSETDSW